MPNKTPLYNIHVSLGAKMVEFAGFEMPLQYTGVLDEHKCVREGVGVFDVSHMGEIWIKGKNALNLIQYISTNDASKLKPGDAQYSCMPNGQGGIVDDIIVYRYSEDKYFLVVNASNTEKDWAWINKNNKFGAELENSSQNIAQLALQGPKAKDVLQKLTSYNLNEIGSFCFKQMDLSGIKDVIVSNTGYTGAGGYELYLKNDDVVELWKAFMENGQEYSIKPCGLACRDTLRLEKGYSLYGHELDERTSPIEAGLGWVVKFNKESDFIDKEDMLKIKSNGVAKRLVGFEMIEKGIPRHGYEIVDITGNVIGQVTSGTMSPSLGKSIGMGYVKQGFKENGTIINILIRNKKIKAKVVSLPFL